MLGYEYMYRYMVWLFGVSTHWMVGLCASRWGNLENVNAKLWKLFQQTLPIRNLLSAFAIISAHIPLYQQRYEISIYAKQIRKNEKVVFFVVGMSLDVIIYSLLGINDFILRKQVGTLSFSLLNVYTYKSMYLQTYINTPA